ncbi:MAG: transcriptional regulator [Bacteroides sp.]|nr:transcriptional regulator [Bacteroides sp.]
MRHLILSFLFVIGLSLHVAANPAPATDTLSVDRLMALLDETLRKSAEYTSVRELRIAQLKYQQQRSYQEDSAYLRWNREIYEEYKAYVCDSALHYLNLNLAWAEKHHHAEAANQARLELAYLMASTGMYDEAGEVLRRVASQSLTRKQQSEYYNNYLQLYTKLATYTQDITFKQRYGELADAYNDSLMYSLLPTDSLYLERRELNLSAAGHWKEAMDINNLRMKKARPGTPYYALVTYHRSLLYRQQGNRNEEKRCLLMSAITDIQLAITDHASLWNLAEILYEEGDLEHAYQYIRFSWNETNRYNARSRSLQTAGILSLIDFTYQAMRERQNNSLRFYICLISTLTLLLLIAIGYIYRQMKRLRIAHKQLENSNAQLYTSNRIKEEYLGRFMNLCSIYIKRLDSYRKTVNNKITAGQTEELLKMVRSREMLNKEVKELYDNFDKTFLHLFPDFIEKFNELLLPEERIYPHEDELLTTELRIFALIRLGIYDSSQIADFLRYSVNTIYNYRAKVKNKANCPREEFEKRVIQIR